jgi:hypothetical protein
MMRLIEPMTLGNMRENGVRSLDVSCWLCHHRAIGAEVRTAHGLHIYWVIDSSHIAIFGREPLRPAI